MTHMVGGLLVLAVAGCGAVPGGAGAAGPSPGATAATVEPDAGRSGEPSPAEAEVAAAEEAGVPAIRDAMARGAAAPVRVVTVTTQTWGCCGVAPFISAEFPVGGPDEAYLLTVPRPGVADPEPARRPGLRLVLWGTLRGEPMRVRDWLAERGRPLPTRPDAVANLDRRYPVLDVTAWCVEGGIGPTRCVTAIPDDPAVVVEPAPPAPPPGPHPLVAGEPGAWTASSEPTADGERVTLRGPRERGVTLELTLELASYDQEADAGRALDDLAASADPDTGLSYGWDVVERRGRHVVRLHGGCRWSAPRWTAITARLTAWLGPADGPSLTCSCGGGCQRP